MAAKKITPEELAYQARLIGQLREAQVAWASWAGHLAQRYELGPQDSITEAGVIVRGSPPHAIKALSAKAPIGT